MKWISVQERLPKAFEPVIVCREIGGGEVKVEQGHKDVTDWWKVYPAFDEAVRKGADEANGEILGTAFRLATGYTQTVQEPVKVRSAVRDEETGRWMQVDTVEIVSYEKTFPPDANMTRFLLVNRLPEHYRMKQEIDAKGNVQLTDEDRALLRCVEERLRASGD